ncbi:MAG: radical SAM family heme chaperone HemW [Chlamydiia bacterium]
MWTAGKTPSYEAGTYSLYVHIPFCRRKCPYCHFYVTPFRLADAELLVEGLIAEHRLLRSTMTPLRLTSLYLGGGTPALLPAHLMQRLLEELLPAGTLDASDVEISLEANPEDLTEEHLHTSHALGINRLSLGVQSLQEEELKRLGRHHTADQALVAIEQASQIGFKNISIDLMMETPGQTRSSWQETLQRAIQLPVQHLSLYNLTIEPHTAFDRQRQKLQTEIPSPEVGAMMLEDAKSIAATGGFERYEISAFARRSPDDPARLLASRHNTGYWLGRPFWGIGPSAWSFWHKQRFHNLPHLHRWARTVLSGELARSEEESLSAEARQREMLAVGLRLTDGLDLDLFQRQWGDFSPTLSAQLITLSEQELLVRTPSRIHLTERGLDLHDLVASELVLATTSP